MSILANDGDSKPVNLTDHAVTFSKAKSIAKHGSHDQKTHGVWVDDSEGENSIESKNRKTPKKLSDLKDDSEGEFEDSNYDSPRHMDEMDLRPYGGAAFAKTWRKESPVAKHGGGSHDQASHGSWAGNGAGGKNIQDMSASDQKEFIDRMSSAKSGEEQRKIIDEFQNRQKGGAKSDAPKKISKDDMDGSSKQGSVTTTPGVLDKLFGKGEKVEGDEYERKVTEAWTFEMKNPSTGESFKAQVYDFMRYDEMGLTSEQGQKLAPMGRSKNGTFSIGTSSKSNADAVQDYITSNSK